MTKGILILMTAMPTTKVMVVMQLKTGLRLRQ